MIDAARCEEVRILLAEDDRAFRELIADALGRLGFEVVVAASGSEALAIAATDGFELLITDVVMPGMSGFELAERLRQRSPGLPVIFMSGYRQDELCQGRALPVHASLLRKPFDLDALAEQVRAALAEAPQAGVSPEHVPA